jgi:predicted permease
LSSFLNLMTVERGFEADRVITVELSLPAVRYELGEGVRFVTTLADRVRALPGVASAGVTDALPLSGVANSAITVEGTDLLRQQRPSATIRFADRGYFETMGIALRAGRLLDETDTGRGVAVISRRAAETLWPQQDPLGKRFRHGPDDSPWIEVVGVVGDVRSVALSQDPPLHIYRPVADYFYRQVDLAVRTSADTAGIAPAIHQIIRGLDAELPLPTPRAMDDIVAESVGPRRFQMNLMLLLAGAAIFLVGLGIYGVISQSVAQRTGELGLRMALGADWRSIVRLVVRGAMIPVVLGLAMGVPAALGAARALGTLLFGVSPTELMPLGAPPSSSSGLACWRASCRLGAPRTSTQLTRFAWSDGARSRRLMEN